MDKIKPIKLAILLTNIFLILLVIFTIALPYMVTWYVETMGRKASLPATIMVTCYPCVPFVAGSLICLKRLLKNGLNGELFHHSSMRYMRNISLFCVIIAIITLVAGRFYLPFYIVGATFAFLSLLIFSLRAIFIAETEKAVAKTDNGSH